MKIRTCAFCLLLLLVSSGIYGQERVHTVQRGETLYSIARSVGIRAEELMSYNGISDPSRLLAGQRLRIPGQAEMAASFTTYRVVRGDTLFGIARRFSVTVASIRELNNLPESHVLREGETLRIQTGAGSAASRPAANTAPASSAATAATVPVRVEPRETVSRPVDSSINWPVNAQEINYMTGKLSGVVITGSRSESVRSLTRGTVLSAGPFQGFGRVVIVQVDGGYLYVYGGFESLSVREGERVGPGTDLGRLGVDALSSKPQLFFMVYKSNVPIDPATAPRA